MAEENIKKKSVEDILKENDDMIMKYKERMKYLYRQEKCFNINNNEINNHCVKNDNQNTRCYHYYIPYNGVNYDKSDLHVDINSFKNANENKEENNFKGKDRINKFLQNFNNQMQINPQIIENNQNTIPKEIDYQQYSFIKPSYLQKPIYKQYIEGDSDDDSDSCNEINNNNTQRIQRPNNKINKCNIINRYAHLPQQRPISEHKIKTFSYQKQNKKPLSHTATLKSIKHILHAKQNYRRQNSVKTSKCITTPIQMHLVSHKSIHKNPENNYTKYKSNVHEPKRK